MCLVLRLDPHGSKTNEVLSRLLAREITRSATCKRSEDNVRFRMTPTLYMNRYQ